MDQQEFRHRVAIAGGLDRVIGRWQILDVHLIPEVFGDQDEVDFYCSDGSAVYLLRLRSRADKQLSIVPPDLGSGYPTYLIAELPNPRVDDRLLGELLAEFASRLAT